MPQRDPQKEYLCIKDVSDISLGILTGFLFKSAEKWNFWPAEQVLASLRLAHITGYMLARESTVSSDDVFGFAFYSLIDKEGELLFIYIPEKHRKHGRAKKLLSESSLRLATKGMDKLSLEVRASNEGAIKLYKHLGYDTIYTRSKYYKDGEDALIMEKYFDVE